MIEVRLSPVDVRRGEEVGAARMEHAKGEPKWAYDETRSGVATHILGALGELAFCRALDLPWPARDGVGRRLPDVDPAWEVRTTPKNVFKVATNDRPSTLVVFVSGKSPIFVVRGFLVAGWAQAHRPLRDPGKRGRPAYFCSESDFTPIDPDFHALCLWSSTHPWTGAAEWVCVVCGRAWA